MRVGNAYRQAIKPINAKLLLSHKSKMPMHTLFVRSTPCVAQKGTSALATCMQLPVAHHERQMCEGRTLSPGDPSRDASAFCVNER
eukprot:1161487-Pelagomonas_calceolata.AAC.6